MPRFVHDVEEIRRRAEHKIEEGAVTASYKGDVEKTISILNEALATEIVCVLRYMHHYFMATGVHAKSVSNEFKEHADAERMHADMIAERIQQLGGKPDFNPGALLKNSATQYVEGETLADMIREDLIAERIVIEVYQGMIRHFGDDDPTTRIMIEHILKDEEEHASDLSDLLYIVNPETGKTRAQDPGTDPLEIASRQQRSGRGGNDGGSRATSKTGERESPAQPPTESWRPGEKSQPSHERLESTQAGPPGSPEFSTPLRPQEGGSKSVQPSKPGARGEKRPDKNWKLAKPGRK
jgi:bacterioferritin